MDLLMEQKLVLIKEGHVSISTEQFEPKASKVRMSLSMEGKETHWRSRIPNDSLWNPKLQKYTQVSTDNTIRYFNYEHFMFTMFKIYL